MGQLTLEDEWKLSTRNKCGRERCPGLRDSWGNGSEAERAQLTQGAEHLSCDGKMESGTEVGAHALSLHGAWGDPVKRE